MKIYVLYWVKNNKWKTLYEFIYTPINYLCPSIHVRPTFANPYDLMEKLCENIMYFLIFMFAL